MTTSSRAARPTDTGPGRRIGSAGRHGSPGRSLAASSRRPCSRAGGVGQPVVSHRYRTGEPIRRYEHATPARCCTSSQETRQHPDGGGWRFVGRATRQRNRHATLTPAQPPTPPCSGSLRPHVIDDHPGRLRRDPRRRNRPTAIGSAPRVGCPARTPGFDNGPHPRLRTRALHSHTHPPYRPNQRKSSAPHHPRARRNPQRTRRSAYAPNHTPPQHSARQAHPSP